MPYHTESEMPAGGRALLANAYMEGRTYLFDFTDPLKPRQAGVLAADSAFAPHWLSREPGTDRIVVTTEFRRPAVRLARFDSTAGTLTWDESFRDRPDGPLGVSFDRTQWPHGKTGRSLPHGAVFSRARNAER